jgi:hypothetical protein
MGLCRRFPVLGGALLWGLCAKSTDSDPTGDPGMLWDLERQDGHFLGLELHLETGVGADSCKAVLSVLTLEERSRCVHWCSWWGCEGSHLGSSAIICRGFGTLGHLPASAPPL